VPSALQWGAGAAAAVFARRGRCQAVACGRPSSSRVNRRIPPQLLRAGVRLTSLTPPQTATTVDAEQSTSGVPLDHLDDVVIDIDDRQAKARGFRE
jgi:hypothetical protein